MLSSQIKAMSSYNKSAQRAPSYLPARSGPRDPPDTFEMTPLGFGRVVERREDGVTVVKLNSGPTAYIVGPDIGTAGAADVSGVKVSLGQDQSKKKEPEVEPDTHEQQHEQQQKQQPEQPEQRVHKLVRGDSLERLSLLYGVSIFDLKKANNILHRHDLMPLFATTGVAIIPGSAKEADGAELEAAAQRAAVQRHVDELSCSHQEARFYLEDNDWAEAAALVAHRQDIEWEARNPLPSAGGGGGGGGGGLAGGRGSAPAATAKRSEPGLRKRVVMPLDAVVAH